ncbi:MAG: hypothetical protein QM762_26245 [Chryseolinea sp.]
MSPEKSTTDRVRRLIDAEKHLLLLMRNNLDLETFNTIDESFHMEKIAELTFMLQQIDDMSDRLRRLDNFLVYEYQRVFKLWEKDARWLNNRILNNNTRSLK